jgi:hypothetical protein
VPLLPDEFPVPLFPDELSPDDVPVFCSGVSEDDEDSSPFASATLTA